MVQCFPDWSKDCGITRRCKLFLGAEFERGAMVQENLLVGPPPGRDNQTGCLRHCYR